MKRYGAVLQAWNQKKLAAIEQQDRRCGLCKERVEPMGASRHPANVASTACVQTIVARPDVNGRCEEAVRRLDPDADGVWMFDLRENAQGVPLVTECNVGRFGTTSLFWKAAGGNLPLMLVSSLDPWPLARAVPDRDCCRVGATWLRTADAEPMLDVRVAHQAVPVAA